jgi:hypothetical protein
MVGADIGDGQPFARYVLVAADDITPVLDKRIIHACAATAGVTLWLPDQSHARVTSVPICAWRSIYLLLVLDGATARIRQHSP